VSQQTLPRFEKSQRRLFNPFIEEFVPPWVHNPAPETERVTQVHTREKTGSKANMH